MKRIETFDKFIKNESFNNEDEGHRQLINLLNIAFWYILENDTREWDKDELEMKSTEEYLEILINIGTDEALDLASEIEDLDSQLKL